MRQTVLMTGASSGTGKATAQEFWPFGIEVALVESGSRMVPPERVAQRVLDIVQGDQPSKSQHARVLLLNATLGLGRPS